MLLQEEAYSKLNKLHCHLECAQKGRNRSWCAQVSTPQIVISQEYDVVNEGDNDDDDGSWEKEIEDMLEAEESG